MFRSGGEGDRRDQCPSARACRVPRERASPGRLQASNAGMDAMTQAMWLWLQRPYLAPEQITAEQIEPIFTKLRDTQRAMCNAVIDEAPPS